MRIRNLAVRAVETNAKLPSEYYRLFRWWFAFGFPAFAADGPTLRDRLRAASQAGAQILSSAAFIR